MPLSRTSLVVLICWFLAVGGMAGVTIKENPRRTPSKPYENSHFLTVDSVLFHYREWNDTLTGPEESFLVHGFCGSSFSWRKTSNHWSGQGSGSLPWTCHRSVTAAGTLN
ncbi:MAG: hypothetical protein MZV63_55400 [Marinilabiliales bacterium]|nr:hypothetical protein [Marinilabiliales bacterium]